MAGREACLAPVLDFDEAWAHPHVVERGVFTRFDGVLHPSPAPRFSRTPGSLRRPAPAAGVQGPEVLAGWGPDGPQLEALRCSGALHQP